MYSILRKLYLYITHSYLFRYVISELKYASMGFWAILDDIKHKRWNKFDVVNLSGRVAVVTGGARGIGFDVVKKLLECNVHVIIGCRNTNLGEELIKKLRKKGFTSGTCDVYELDLASFSSIKKFAAMVSKNTDKLHILVNNAGIFFPPYTLTENGYESQWGVNYLGPFLLTHLLFPLIVNAASESECRIVNVSSCAHKLCRKIAYSELNDKSKFITGISYSYSKAAQVSFTLHLNNILKERSLNISTFAVHPGIVNTDLFNGTPAKLIMPWLFKYICKSSEEGATTILYSCTSSNLSGLSGLYLSNCRATSPSKFTQDDSERSALFNNTLKELKINTFGVIN